MRLDYHIHTEHLGCADKTMKIEKIADYCQELGVEEIAITDHLNKREEVDLHRKVKNEILQLDHELKIYFGAELNFIEEFGDFAADKDIKEEIGFQFFIGGIHSAYGTDREPMEILKTQHLHHLETCKNELVKVLVHPYWFSAGTLEKMPWLTDLKKLPEKWVEELAQTAIKTDTVIEINYHAIFSNDNYKDSFKRSYKDFICQLKKYGVKFAMATDAHNIEHLKEVKLIEELFDELNIPEAQIWSPSFFDIREVN